MLEQVAPCFHVPFLHIEMPRLDVLLFAVRPRTRVVNRPCDMLNEFM